MMETNNNEEEKNIDFEINNNENQNNDNKLENIQNNQITNTNLSKMNKSNIISIIFSILFLIYFFGGLIILPSMKNLHLILLWIGSFLLIISIDEVIKKIKKARNFFEINVLFLLLTLIGIILIFFGISNKITFIEIDIIKIIPYLLILAYVIAVIYILSFTIYKIKQYKKNRWEEVNVICIEIKRLHDSKDSSYSYSYSPV